MAVEMTVALLMNYPSLYGKTFTEGANEWDEGVEFISNDLLLCLMLFTRFHYSVRTILDVSFFTDPRS